MTAADIANTAQAEVWNGQAGVHWADHHDRYDTMADEFNNHLSEAAALTETSRVLDISCGTGRTTRLAARRTRRGHAVGIDLSMPMLDRARRQAAEEGSANVTFVQGDAQVHPFPTNCFQVAISRAGVMFFADPVAAFANIGRAGRDPQCAGPGCRGLPVRRGAAPDDPQCGQGECGPGACCGAPTTTGQHG